jgi:hypothetical protein
MHRVAKKGLKVILVVRIADTKISDSPEVEQQETETGLKIKKERTNKNARKRKL